MSSVVNRFTHEVDIFINQFSNIHNLIFLNRLHPALMKLSSILYFSDSPQSVASCLQRRKSLKRWVELCINWECLLMMIH